MEPWYQELHSPPTERCCQDPELNPDLALRYTT